MAYLLDVFEFRRPNVTITSSYPTVETANCAPAVPLALLAVGNDNMVHRLITTGATAVVDVYEGRGARADLRIGRLPIEEVACAPLRSTGQH